MGKRRQAHADGAGEVRHADRLPDARGADDRIAHPRAGQPPNNGDEMCYRTLLPTRGRMATCTIQAIAWEQALNSTEDITPAASEWSGAPVVEIARPGILKFVAPLGTACERYAPQDARSEFLSPKAT
jgi:hypothetical protein